MEGKEGGITSQQKLLVLQELEKQGYPMSRIKQILSTKKLANSFLLLHEQDHINNNDKDVYFKNSRDLLTPDKIAIEARATVNALQQLESQSTTQPQATQPVAGEQLELFGDVADVQSILDNAQETAGESNVFNLTPGPKLKYEALLESVNVAGNKKSLKDNGIDSAKAFSKFMEDFNGTQEQAEEHLRECFGIKF